MEKTLRAELDEYRKSAAHYSQEHVIRMLEAAKAEARSAAERERDEARQQRDALAEALKVLGPPLQDGQPHWLLGATAGAREFLQAAGEYSGDLSDMAILAEVVRVALAKAGRHE